MALWADQAATATGLNGLAQGRFVGVTISGPPTTGSFAIGDFVVTQNGNTWVCTASGAPGTWTTPTTSGDVVATGQEVFSRRLLASTSVTCVTQGLLLSYFTARKTETSTQVRVLTGTTAASGTAPTICRLGLYAIDASTLAGTLVASTVNDTTLFSSASTAYTRSWSSPYSLVSGTRYALGTLVVDTGTLPTFLGITLGTSAMLEANTVAPRLTARLLGQSDLPSSFTDAGLNTSNNSIIYGVVLP